MVMHCTQKFLGVARFAPLAARSMQSWAAMEEDESSTAAATSSDRLASETPAEVAREFRKALNRSRPSRKRYSVSSAHYGRQQSSSSSLEASGKYTSFTQTSHGSFEASGSYFNREENPFISSTDGGPEFADAGEVSPGALDGEGEAIYREFVEYDSLSKFKNTLRKIVPQPIRASLLPPRSWKDWRRFMFTHLPILHWLWTYRASQLIGDFIAGITIGITHIPQGNTI